MVALTQKSFSAHYAWFSRGRSHIMAHDQDFNRYSGQTTFQTHISLRDETFELKLAAMKPDRTRSPCIPVAHVLNRMLIILTPMV